MSTQPTEAQYALACRIWCCKNSGDGAQLIADSEARVVEAEREKVRVLREACKKDADVYRTLERELAEATAEASHYMAVAQKATDELIFFRADNLKAHQMTCAAALERDAEREKVRVLREALEKYQHTVIAGGTNPALAALAATEESK
jgi:dsDNA-specific endonuclease/ATPase MutS2